MAKRLGDRVSDWITLKTMVHSLSWVWHRHPCPGIKDRQAALKRSTSWYAGPMDWQCSACGPRVLRQPDRDYADFTPAILPMTVPKRQRYLERADICHTWVSGSDLCGAAIQKIFCPDGAGSSANHDQDWQLSVRRSTSLVSITLLTLSGARQQGAGAAR